MRRPPGLRRIAQAIHGRLEDGNDRGQLIQIAAVAEARPVVELLGHLGVAGVRALALVLMEMQEASSKSSPMKSSIRRIDPPGHRRYLIADRQIAQGHLSTVVSHNSATRA